jgi:signal transduction histidine kinase
LQRARHALNHSLRVRLVVLFVMLAMAMTLTFLGGMQRALKLGWREAARPLVADYVDHLVADLGLPPSVQRAQDLSERLPITLRISGPVVNWQSDPAPHHHNARRSPHLNGGDEEARGNEQPLLERTTADGHRIEFGLHLSLGQDEPRRVGWITLGVLLAFTALAYLYLSRLLRPLQDIRAGARRFGSGDFGSPIPVRRRDELGSLAIDINGMAGALHDMLEAKRALLLAISHELRSPLTRARLNTELLPDTGDGQALRTSLLRDLAIMRDLITDLLESERLGQGHSVLHLEPTPLADLVRSVATELGLGEPQLHLPSAGPTLMLDASRVRLLVRNLLDNALRHGAQALEPVQIGLNQEPTSGRWILRVRDHGPGVPEASLPHLTQPFYRPDAARTRQAGGVGLGLYLCQLVAQAHGAQWTLRNAQPGLEVLVAFNATAA